MPVVFAHQGGWDEMLLVLGPIAIIVSLVGVANRRANRGGSSSTESGSPRQPGA